MSFTCLACTVRACGLPLARYGRTLDCPAGHAFDIARAGYVNLLQPQDRRSRIAGDTGAAVDARSRLLAAGVGRALLTRIAAAAAALPDQAVVVDLGSGGGEVVGEITADTRLRGIGIDLSVAATERAARRYAGRTWVVANADRRLPVVSGCAAMVASVHGRRNPAECARVLAADGILLVAVPAKEDLQELRQAIGGHATSRDRTEAVVAEHAASFTLERRERVREQHVLDRAGLLDLLRGTYRGERRSAAARIETLVSLTVTVASELLVFRRPGA